jgi:hypothetical protein
VAARVELFEAIRTVRRREQLSVRALAERHQVHRRTVRQALDSALPPARKSYPRSRPAIGPWTDIIDAWLEGDESVPRKQRHTARRIWQRLGAEYDASLSEVSSVRAAALGVREGRPRRVHQPGSGSVPRRTRPGVYRVGWLCGCQFRDSSPNGVRMGATCDGERRCCGHRV